MKKIVFCFLLIVCLLEVEMVYAEDDVLKLKNTLVQFNIIDENYFSNSDIVTREECLIAIMRVIGVTDEEIEKLNGGDLISFADTDSFSYFGCAWVGKIAYGEECVVVYPTQRTAHTLKNTDFFFFPNRAITTKECLALMIRCLQSDKTDFDLTIKEAKDNGLINDQDNFTQDPNSLISQDDFFVLLERLLQQKRYKYYGRENGVFKMEGNIDEDHSMSYLEMLMQ